MKVYTICLIFLSASPLAFTCIGQLQAHNNYVLLNMKTKKVEEVTTTLKDRIGHLLKRHLTKIRTRVNNFKVVAQINQHTIKINN